MSKEYEKMIAILNMKEVPYSVKKEGNVYIFEIYDLNIVIGDDVYSLNGTSIDSFDTLSYIVRYWY